MILDAALKLASLGFKPFPVVNKRPIHKMGKGFSNASSDSDVVKEMFGLRKDTTKSDQVEPLIGVVHHGWCIIDIDGEEGMRTYEYYKHNFPEPVAITQTRSGGLHLHVKEPTDLKRKRHIRILPGIDILMGHSGYVIFPPSAGYIWTKGDAVDIARGIND